MRNWTIILAAGQALAAVGVGGMSVGVAAAQCDIYWPGIPDFDQRRNALVVGGDVWVGLPSNGAYYCVPTSSTNCLAVIDASGYNIMTGVSPGNWYAHGQYNAVGNFIGLLGGDWMGTGGINSNGTTFSGGVDGMQDWIDERNLGDRFISQGFEYDGDEFPKAKWIYNHLKASHLTMYCWGYWSLDGDQLERDGGHSLTAVGMLDGCSSTQTQVMYHDPNTSDSRYDQSEFATTTRTLYRRHLNMDGDWSYVWTIDQSRDGSGDAVRIIDSVRWIAPSVALATHPINPALLRVARLAGVWHEGGGVADLASPTGGPIIDAALSHLDASYLVLCGAGRSRAGLYRYDPEGGFTRLQEFARNPDRILIDRGGQWFIQAGAVITRYKLVDDTPTAMASITLPTAVTAWAYDDAADGIVALTSANGRITRLSRGLTAIGDTPIPTGVVMAGDGSVAVNPLTGRPWITSSGSPSVYEITFDPANGRSRLQSQATHASLTGVEGLTFNDMGHMLAIGGGQLRVLAHTDAAGWQPAARGAWSELGAVGAGRLLHVLTSRHNANPRHSGPAWDNIDPPEDDATNTIRDCGPDFNLDGFLDFFDYDDFVRCFESGVCPRGRDADYTNDGFVDFFDYDQFVRDFEVGC